MTDEEMLGLYSKVARAACTGPQTVKRPQPMRLACSSPEAAHEQHQQQGQELGQVLLQQGHQGDHSAQHVQGPAEVAAAACPVGLQGVSIPLQNGHDVRLPWTQSRAGVLRLLSGQSAGHSKTLLLTWHGSWPQRGDTRFKSNMCCFRLHAHQLQAWQHIPSEP